MKYLNSCIMQSLYIAVLFHAASINAAHLNRRSASGLFYNHWTPSNPKPSVPSPSPLFEQPDTFWYNAKAVKYFPQIACGVNSIDPAKFIGGASGTVTKVSPFPESEPDDYFWYLKVPVGNPQDDLAFGIYFTEGRGYDKKRNLVPGYYRYYNADYTASPNVCFFITSFGGIGADTR